MKTELKTAESIAQWVIDNRYPKSENDKVSDHDIYHTVKEAIESHTLRARIAELEKSEAYLLKQVAEKNAYIIELEKKQ